MRFFEYKKIIGIILFSVLICKGDDSYSALEIRDMILSKSEEEGKKGLALMDNLSQRDKDQISIDLLGIQTLWDSTLFFGNLPKRFPEIEYVSLPERMKTLEFSPHGGEYRLWYIKEKFRDIKNIKIWWKANKDKILYHNLYLCRNLILMTKLLLCQIFL